nr:uncharacterized protein LOC117217664 isoform X4 [Megalopta genalis]
MVPNEELKNKIDSIYTACATSINANSIRDQDKLLNHVWSITKHSLQEHLLSYNPDIIITFTLKFYLHYNKTLRHTHNICEWKRRRKRRFAKECYNNLLKIYIPEKSKEISQAVVNTIYEEKLWEFETDCFEVLCTLLESGVSGALMFHIIWDKIENPNINPENTRRIIRILYELLDVYDWPDSYDTILVIERILNLFYISVTDTKLNNHITPYATLKKGLEVCIINMVKHVCNDHLLIIVQHMCSWAVEPGMTDEIILEFGSTLEYTAYMHEVALYEKTLTPKVFPLLMDMIASKSKIISLLEIPCGFTAAAIVCLIMNLQDMTLRKGKHQAEVSYHLHAIIIAIMSLLCWVHKAKVFYEYVNKIMLERAQWAPHLNPPIQSQYNFAAHHILWDKPDLFFVDWEARYGLWKCFRLRETDDYTNEL